MSNALAIRSGLSRRLELYLNVCCSLEMLKIWACLFGNIQIRSLDV